jgi:hypothetical protein
VTGTEEGGGSDWTTIGHVARAPGVTRDPSRVKAAPRIWFAWGGAPRCPNTVGIPRRGNARRQVARQAKVLVHHEGLHQDHLRFVWLESEGGWSCYILMVCLFGWRRRGVEQSRFIFP